MPRREVVEVDEPLLNHDDICGDVRVACCDSGVGDPADRMTEGDAAGERLGDRRALPVDGGELGRGRTRHGPVERRERAAPGIDLAVRPRSSLHLALQAFDRGDRRGERGICDPPGRAGGGMLARVIRGREEPQREQCVLNRRDVGDVVPAAAPDTRSDRGRRPDRRDRIRRDLGEVDRLALTPPSSDAGNAVRDDGPAVQRAPHPLRAAVEVHDVAARTRPEVDRAPREARPVTQRDDEIRGQIDEAAPRIMIRVEARLPFELREIGVDRLFPTAGSVVERLALLPDVLRRSARLQLVAQRLPSRVGGHCRVDQAEVFDECVAAKPELRRDVGGRARPQPMEVALRQPEIRSGDQKRRVPHHLGEALAADPGIRRVVDVDREADGVVAVRVLVGAAAAVLFCDVQRLAEPPRRQARVRAHREQRSLRLAELPDEHGMDAVLERPAEERRIDERLEPPVGCELAAGPCGMPASEKDARTRASWMAGRAARRAMIATGERPQMRLRTAAE